MYIHNRTPLTFREEEFSEMFVLVEESSLGNGGTKVRNILTSGDCNTAGGRERVKSAKSQVGEKGLNLPKFRWERKG